jgi:flagellar motor switch protein FliN/FliY
MIENGSDLAGGAAAEPLRPFEAPVATGTSGHAQAGLSMDAVMTIPVVVQVVLGSTTMPVAELMKLSRGAVLALDHKVGEPVDVVVNGRVVARGELVVMDDDNSRFGVSLTEIVGSPAARMAG